MNDKNFIEELRQKREEYGVTQTRLAVACGISREYYNRIEKGKQPLNDELREIIEKQIERFNPQEPLFLLIDYFRVRFPTTDALAIIRDVLQLKSDYMLYEDYGKYGYEMDYYSTCRDAMEQDIQLLLTYKNWDEVVTHNPKGEYGKYHHQQVSQMVTQIFDESLKEKSQLYYFGKYYPKGEEIPGDMINEENLKTKEKLVNEYQPTARGAIKAFGHMIPYENWILEENWK